ncbi:MAG TPA: hypothetical protein VG734_14835 [Lacunisphaera sp.]|nr:hypothetical protein [Lacunisphaera sp.]
MTHPPPFKVDYGAGLRITAENRARNKQATEEFEASFKKIAAGLRAWQIALQRSARLVDAFEEIG